MESPRKNEMEPKQKRAVALRVLLFLPLVFMTSTEQQEELR